MERQFHSPDVYHCTLSYLTLRATGVSQQGWVPALTPLCHWGLSQESFNLEFMRYPTVHIYHSVYFQCIFCIVLLQKAFIAKTCTWFSVASDTVKNYTTRAMNCLSIM